MDYLESIKFFKKIKENSEGFPEVRVAVLGDSTTQQLCQILRACLFRKKLFPVLYEAEYQTMDQEILNSQSGLYQFHPGFIVLHTSMQTFRQIYDESNEAQKGELAQEHLLKYKTWWENLKKNSPAAIIQNLLALPLERPFGNYTHRVSHSLYANIAELNRLIVNAAQSQPQLYLNDVEFTASMVGKQNFFDEKIWIHAKIFCALEFLPKHAENIAAIVAAASGKLCKCLILDCDHTLWGGTIGDDGIQGIELGHQGVGEAFVRFQHYLKGLKDRGLILVVCSKNDHDTALEVFRKHPNMVLKEDDISLFMVNWNHKADNLRHIMQTLNLAESAFVFIDDSPFERNLARTYFPDMQVPELPEDPADYAAYLDSLNFFETIALSSEDKRRTEFYLNDLKRKQEEGHFSSIDDYLKSLQMEARFARFDTFHLPRIVQLIGRSNQFNLTTQRHNETQCRSFMEDHKDFDPFYISLKDKFGDSGLIGVIILRYEGQTALIDTWLMSCRVLLRGVEQFAMNKIAEAAKNRSCKELVGMYIPTTKNKMVADFYGKFGFRKTAEDPSGAARWQLDLTNYVPQEHFIQEEKGKEEWPAAALLKN